MKYLLTTMLSICLLFTFSFGAEKVELKDQKDRESYSLGYQFGQSLKYQGLEINLEVYATGIRDALSGKSPLMAQEEIRSTIAELEKRLVAARQKELKKIAEKNLSESKAFMEVNKKKDGVITLPSGVQYKVLVEGSGKQPGDTDEVIANLKGTLIDGTEINSSSNNGFRANQVTFGWGEALRLMKEGSKWQVFVPPQLGYGERDMGRVPPNSVLIFEVELLAVK